MTVKSQYSPIFPPYSDAYDSRAQEKAVEGSASPTSLEATGKDGADHSVVMVSI